MPHVTPPLTPVTPPLTPDEEEIVNAIRRCTWQRADLVDICHAFVDESQTFKDESAPTHYRVEYDIDPERVLIRVTPKHLRRRCR